jgi:thymidine kinase
MKLYFRYGCMDSSKTLRLLADANEYTERGEQVLLLKPEIDSRSEQGFIESRIGLKAPCITFNEKDDLLNLLLAVKEKVGIPQCILVDEAQFLKALQVVNLRMVADRLGVPVMCYGLKSDFQGNMFEGSKALFEHANRVEEVKTICREKGCKKKAMYNGRFKNGLPVFDGDSVRIGDTEGRAEDSDFYYVPKCSVHFFQDLLDYEKRRKGEN